MHESRKRHKPRFLRLQCFGRDSQDRPWRFCSWTVFICLILIADLVASSAKGEAQKPGKPKPDLSGTWVLHNPKGSSDSLEITLNIEHNDPEIRIMRKARLAGQERVDRLAYYSDERGESNPSLESTKPTKSKTKWNDNELESRSSYTTRIAGDTIFVDESETWQISMDGTKLIQKSKIWLRTNTPGAGFFPDRKEKTRIYLRDSAPAKTP